MSRSKVFKKCRVLRLENSTHPNHPLLLPASAPVFCVFGSSATLSNTSWDVTLMKVSWLWFIDDDDDDSSKDYNCNWDYNGFPSLSIHYLAIIITIAVSLLILRQWIPQLYLYHTIIFEDYHQRLQKISITRKLSGTYHQRLPKTAWQHQVFEPGVENRASVCVMEERPLPLLSSSAIRRRSFPHLDLDLCPSAGVLGGWMRGVERRYSL